MHRIIQQNCAASGQQHRPGDQPQHERLHSPDMATITLVEQIGQHRTAEGEDRQIDQQRFRQQAAQIDAVRLDLHIYRHARIIRRGLAEADIVRIALGACAGQILADQRAIHHPTLNARQHLTGVELTQQRRGPFAAHAKNFRQTREFGGGGIGHAG